MKRTNMSHPMKSKPARNGMPEVSKLLETGPMGRTVRPAKGSPPKSSMIDGPYGGKKPA